jgi:hypothetical protein
MREALSWVFELARTGVGRTGPCCFYEVVLAPQRRELKTSWIRLRPQKAGNDEADTPQEQHE